MKSLIYYIIDVKVSYLIGRLNKNLQFACSNRKYKWNCIFFSIRYIFEFISFWLNEVPGWKHVHLGCHSGSNCMNFNLELVEVFSVIVIFVIRYTNRRLIENNFTSFWRFRSLKIKGKSFYKYLQIINKRILSLCFLLRNLWNVFIFIWVNWGAISIMIGNGWKFW